MPTAFTGDICDGKPVTFEEFVWRCTRGMSVAISMRDESLDRLPPEKFEPDLTYHTESLQRAEVEIERLKSLSWADVALEHAALRNTAIAHNTESDARHAEVRGRLERMRMLVADWTPPTEGHVGLKRFMLEQLDMTIDFDARYHPITILPMTDREWFEREFVQAQDARDRAIAEIAEERRRAEERTAWVQALAASVPRPSAKP